MYVLLSPSCSVFMIVLSLLSRGCNILLEIYLICLLNDSDFPIIQVNMYKSSPMYTNVPRLQGFINCSINSGTITLSTLCNPSSISPVSTVALVQFWSQYLPFKMEILWPKLYWLYGSYEGNTVKKMQPGVA